jgi:hypothetical protein
MLKFAFFGKTVDNIGRHLRSSGILRGVVGGFFLKLFGGVFFGVGRRAGKK